MITLYRGYYNDILLAVSDTKSNVKLYLKSVRGLSSSQYYISSINIDSRDAYSLYSDVWLDEYMKDLYVPQRDIEYIDNMVQLEFNNFVNTLNGMREYYQVLSSIDSMSHHAKHLNECIKNMEEELTTKKILRKLQKRIIRRNGILSCNINEYLHIMRIVNEINEMNNLYKYKLYTD